MTIAGSGLAPYSSCLPLWRGAALCALLLRGLPLEAGSCLVDGLPGYCVSHCGGELPLPSVRMSPTMAGNSLTDHGPVSLYGGELPCADD